MNNCYRRIVRFEQVERFLATDMTATEWCALNGISESTLYRWMREYRQCDSEERLANTQQHKQTSDWIALSRENLAAKVAIVPAVQTSCSAPTTQIPAPSSLCTDETAKVIKTNADPIIVNINGISVSVPVGTSTCDIASVLQAVAIL